MHTVYAGRGAIPIQTVAHIWVCTSQETGTMSAQETRSQSLIDRT